MLVRIEMMIMMRILSELFILLISVGPLTANVFADGRANSLGLLK